EQPLGAVPLRVLPVVRLRTGLETFIRQMSGADGVDRWLVVDDEGGFVGLVEVLPLLQRLVGEQYLFALYALLEQFPLPMALRDPTTGNVLGMNRGWREHFAALMLTATYQQCVVSHGESIWQVVQIPCYQMDVAIAYDITAQRQLSQELAGLNRLKDEFLACISHELKTPLTSVIGMASLLKTHTFGDLNDRQDRYVQMIHQSGRQLLTIIDNMVDLAKAESGQLTLELEPVAIKEVCHQSIHHTRRLLDARLDMEAIAIEVDIEPDLEMITADSTRLMQMLASLLSNACKFSLIKPPPQPAVVRLIIRRWEGWIAFTVWDEGIGIPADKQHLVFQKFQQVEQVLTRRSDGTGMGLVLTRHLARLHGGDVTFVSQEGVGSQFTILLPPEPPLPAEVMEPVPVSRSRLVLLAATLPDDIAVIAHWLTDWGYRLVVARTGPEALEKARQLLPGVILLSPELPVLSGWDVLALLKQEDRRQRLVMVLQPTDGVMMPADGVVRKPITADSLGAVFAPMAIAPRTPKVLYLRGAEELTIEEPALRLLEVEDLSQGNLLSRIWRPDVLLIHGDRPSLNTELASLSGAMSQLPILLLSRNGNLDLTRLRRQFSHLNLHCILDPQMGLQEAIAHLGCHWQAPTILLLNLGQGEALPHSFEHYLQLLGGLVHLANDPETVRHYLAVSDVVVALLSNQSKLTPAEQEAITLLQASGLPIIVVDGRHDREGNGELENPDGLGHLMYLADAILAQPEAITQLLPTLQRCLQRP
ncbi:MAG: hybrid sensor histidine kinase/response regulator, partial [Oscillatoriales cyanobacterium SM2_2_1]|nr:hybrid sensor histidine kinase/response regulator [Oscillatoriales cyanobacterium SM2_2_1]